MLFTTLAAAILAVPVVLAQGPTINTPTGVTTCQPTRFTYSGGQPPYILTLTEGTTAGGAVLKEFDGLTGDAFTWNVDLQANTNFISNLKDSQGNIGQSASVMVTAGSNTSCVNATVNESATGQTSIPVSTGAGSSTGTSPATSAGSSTTGGSSTSKPTSSGSSSGSAASPSKTGAANRITVSGFVITGLMGLIGATLY